MPAAHPGEPAVTRMGSDRSTLPDRYPGGDWIALEGTHLSMQVVIEVLVSGERAKAVVDTGASSTVLSEPMAERLGILTEELDTGQVARVMDAHGSIMKGKRVRVPELTVGRRVFTDVVVAVLGDRPGLFLLGADLLQQIDLYLAADEGLLGVFPAGKAPLPPKSRMVSLSRKRRQLQVDASAPSSDGKTVQVELIVDTGASQTAVPVAKGVNGNLPADIKYRQTTLALGGELENRGRFVLDPVALGPERVTVPRVLANPSMMEGGRGLGLLGNDVLLRHHAVISFGRGRMWLAPLPERPAFRTRGPSGVRCVSRKGRRTRCVDVRVRAQAPDTGKLPGALPDRCLSVRVHPAFSGNTLEAAITAEDEAGRPLFAGGALRAYVTAGDDGFQACFALWPGMKALGLSPSSSLSLRWLRTEGIDWPCDPLRTQCLSFTGPLAGS